MFNRKKSAGEQVQKVAPEPSPQRAEEIEAERVIARGNRVKALSEEAAMWRAYSTDCRAGKRLIEDYGYRRSFYETDKNGALIYKEPPPALCLTMDADTAPIWRDFAIRMAEDRERRLRELLNVV